MGHPVAGERGAQGVGALGEVGPALEVDGHQRADTEDSRGLGRALAGERQEGAARLVLALDDHDWDGVTTALAETVHRDYTSLFGGEPDEISGPALAAEWKSAITGLDAHQHLLGTPVVDVEDEEAQAAVHVVATHVLHGDPGSPWVVGGTYRFGLRRVDGHWRIVTLTLDTRWQTGDSAVLHRAASRS